MKLKLILTTVLLLSLGEMTLYAQKFKVTDVQVQNEDYNKIAAKSLGKTLTLEKFDNAITVDMDGRQHLVLKHNSGSYYSTIIDNKPSDTQYFEVFLHTNWAGTITSINMNYTYQGQQPPYKQYTVKLIAKP